MENKCQADDNASSSDQISHGLASSVGENKTIIQNPRDAEVISTISSERVHSAHQTSMRSDVSSESGQPFNEKRKFPDAGKADGVSQGEPTTQVPYHFKQLKTDYSSSKESGDQVVHLSSVDSADPKPCQSTNENSTSGYSHPTQSDESKDFHQEPKPSTTKSDPVAAIVQASHCEFDLNEDVEAECHPKLVHDIVSPIHSTHSSEPIPVVAKFGIPIGLPKKPLQFGGDLGWRRSGFTSAFRSTLLKNHDGEKGSCGSNNNSSSRPSPVSRGFDLNIAAAIDLEFPADESSIYASSEKTERYALDIHGQNGNKNRYKPDTCGFDLNDDPMIEDTCKNIYRQGETQQLLGNSVAVDTATCSRGSANQPISDCRRPPYWVDMSSMRGFGHIQPQTFLFGAPTAEQVQMVVPLQLPHAPPGFYVGKVNSLPPTIYPAGVLPPLHNQQGGAVIPQISGPILATYPGNVHFLGSSQGLNPHAYANMRQTFLPNGSIALMENGSRGVHNAELPVPARNTLFEERMKPVEQVSFCAASTTRRELDAGRDSSQFNCRQMASWN